MATLRELRSAYHDRLAGELLAWRSAGKPNIADTGSRGSVAIAAKMVECLGRDIQPVTQSGQSLGTQFGTITKEFLGQSFSRLSHIRPGEWTFSVSQGSGGIGAYEQYEHLHQVQKILNANPDLKTALGGDYLVTPDIVIGRRPLSDEAIDADGPYLENDKSIARKSPLRACNLSGSPPILHASISCKWTMRSDRAQNTRTEALNLIRNRKGNTPHIMVVTMEPLPTRLASIAMGTGDVDCTYHAALDELKAAVDDLDMYDQAEVLSSLIDGRRLRDISDLPLDLAI